MKNAIILHGRPGKEEYYDPVMPSASNSHWIPWLQAQLQKVDVFTQTPEIPLAYNPKWDIWTKEIERYEISSDTVLVGHSCGGGFWVRYLSEHKDLEVGKVILVAPSFGYRWEDKGGGFFEDFTIDPILSERLKSLVVFNSTNDHVSIQTSVERIKNEVPSTIYREFNYGHFTTRDMGKTEFPELLEEIISK